MFQVVGQLFQAVGQMFQGVEQMFEAVGYKMAHGASRSLLTDTAGTLAGVSATDKCFACVERGLPAEYIGVGARFEEQQRQFLVVLFPGHQPVRLDVTFPLAFVVAFQSVGQVFLGECACFR